MLALLENLTYVFETINVVAVEVHYHLLSAKDNALKISGFAV